MTQTTQPCVFCATDVRPDEDHNSFDGAVTPSVVQDLRFARLGHPWSPVCALCFHTIDHAIAKCVARGINQRGAA